MVSLLVRVVRGKKLLERFEALHLLSMNEKGINTFCLVVFLMQQAETVG